MGKIVSQQILSEPPTFNVVEEAIEQMTPAQLDEMERLLEAAAPEAGLELDEALDRLNTIRGRQE